MGKNVLVLPMLPSLLDLEGVALEGQAVLHRPPVHQELSLHGLVSYPALHQVVYALEAKFRPCRRHRGSLIASLEYRLCFCLPPKLLDDLLLPPPDHLAAYLSAAMHELAGLSQMVPLEDIVAVLQQLLDQLLVPAAHGEVQGRGLVILRLNLEVLCELWTVENVKECCTDGLEQFMAELGGQFDDYLPLGCLLPKPHQLHQYLIPLLLLVVLLNQLLYEDGQMCLSLQHSLSGTDVDQVLKDIIGTVPAASTQTIKIHLFIHSNCIVVLAQLEEIQCLGLARFEGSFEEEAGVVCKGGVVDLVVEVAQVVKEEGVTPEDGPGCLHSQHTLCPLFPALPLLQPHTEQTVEITVTTVLLPSIVYLLQNSPLQLQKILGVVLEAVIGGLVGDVVEQILEPVDGDELQLMQFVELGGDQFDGVVLGEDVAGGGEGRDEGEMVIGEVDQSQLPAIINRMMRNLPDLVVVQHQLLQRYQLLEHYPRYRNYAIE